MFLILHGAEDEGFPLTTIDQVIQEAARREGPVPLEVIPLYFLDKQLEGLTIGEMAHDQ